MLRTSLFSLTLAALCATTHAAAKSDALPNVIYILADDMGYGDLSCYGQDKLSTPNIDRLATEGMKFINHYSGNTVCSPSRASLMLGQHSGNCFLRGNLGKDSEDDGALDPDQTVLPEVFKAAGYATGAFGKWGLGHTDAKGAPNPLSHGFDAFYGWQNQMMAHTYYPPFAVHNGKRVPLEAGDYIHDNVMAEARDFIRRSAEKQQPFFCYLPTAIPHAAMHAPKELHEKWRKRFPQFDDTIGKYRAGKGIDCPDVVNPVAGFAAMMEHLDNEVGLMLAQLEELGIDDNTLIMFSSDNGAHKEGGHNYKFWNSTGSLRGHKRDMHEGGIRVPMLARWPGKIQPGSTTEFISGNWDILATVSEILKQDVPEQNDGVSLLPTLLGNDQTQKQRDYLFWEFHKKDGPFSYAIRKGKWKVYQERNKTGWMPIELYDLEKDPYETNNLAAQNPELVDYMKKVIESHGNL